MKNTLYLSAIIVLSGCASPKVIYDLAKKPVEKAGESPKVDTRAKFQLAESVIKFDYADMVAGVSLGKKISITSVPLPIEATTYTVEGTSAWQNWGVQTKIKTTHRSDTLLLQEVGSEITDTRKQLISDIASAAGTLIGLASTATVPGQKAAAGQSIAPSPLTLAEVLKKCGKDDSSNGITCRLYFNNDGVWDDTSAQDGKEPSNRHKATFIIGQRPDNALKKDKLNFPMPSDSIFYSACRTVSVTVESKLDASLKAAASLRIAEAEYVEFIGLPDKGKVSFGASCGADVVAEDAALPTTMEYVNATLSAAKAIKDAKDKAK